MKKIFQLKPNSIELWLIDLTTVNWHIIPSIFSILSAEEKARALRFSFNKDSQAFILRRFVMRVILAKYLNIRPNEICYSYTENGKPYLTNTSIPMHFNFNLSSSNNMIALLISKKSNVGVDIEYMDKQFPFYDVIKTVCSEQEQAVLAQMPRLIQFRKFWQLWTAKEAYLKAIGIGLMLEPKHIQFSAASISQFSKNLELCKKSKVEWKFKSLLLNSNFMMTATMQTNQLPSLKKHCLDFSTLLSEFNKNNLIY